MADSYQAILNSIQSTAQKNTAQSQAFAREEMKFNAAEAQKNREFQERLSNTAHQREVTDLIAAGLNPVLSTSHQGASTPTGSAATGAKGNVDETYGQALSAYLGNLINSATAIETARIQASATMAAAQASAAAMIQSSKYTADTNFKMHTEYPNTMWGTINNTLSGKGATGSIFNTILGSIKDWIFPKHAS